MSSRPDPDRRRDHDGGFTLVETLVASVVLALFLSVFFRNVVGLRSAAGAFETRTHAELVARSILDEKLSRWASRVGTTSGWRDGQKWTVRTTSFDLVAQLPPKVAQSPSSLSGAPDPTTRQNWTTQRIVVDVETGGRPVEMETIRLVKAPPR